MIYELFLYHLVEDDTELKGIYDSCKKGELMCGACKKRAAEHMELLLSDLHEKRKAAAGKMKEYLK